MKLLIEIRPFLDTWLKFPCEQKAYQDVCVRLFCVQFWLVEIWKTNPDPAFARHPTTFGLVGWVDWVDAGRVEDGTHNATGDLKCLCLKRQVVSQKKHGDDAGNQRLEKGQAQLSQPLCIIPTRNYHEATLKSGKIYFDPSHGPENLDWDKPWQWAPILLRTSIQQTCLYCKLIVGSDQIGTYCKQSKKWS